MSANPKKIKSKREAVHDFQYTSYRLSKGSKIDRVNIDDLEEEEFWDKYISIRKPCIITGVIPYFKRSMFEIQNLNDSLNYKGKLQVEKKVSGGFGSGENRLKMTLKELTEKLMAGDDSLYLTTQYAEDDVEEEIEIGEELANNLKQLKKAAAKTNKGDILDSSSYSNDSSDDGGAFPLPKKTNNYSSSDDDSDDSDDVGKNKSSFPIQKRDESNSSDSDSSDSIDMNNLRDDFDDIDDSSDSLSSEDSDDSDSEIESDVPGEPLTRSEALMRVRELYQPPLTNLSEKELPVQPGIMVGLLPQQINLWMGATSSSKKPELKIDPKDEETLGLGKAVPGEKPCSSSGLHHDHADNLYIPIMGSKRFTLFSPENATKLYTVGDVNNIFSSGVIDYKRNKNAPHWKHINADGSIISEFARWKLDTNKFMSSAERTGLQMLIEHEESVIGIQKAKKGSVKNDPPSFSRIPPALLHLDEIKDPNLRKQLQQFIHAKYPLLEKCVSTSVYLKPGEMLYLPAGWFHEVTSYGNSDSDKKTEPESQIHIALNYWFAPPDTKEYEAAYSTDYWVNDYERTMNSLDYVSYRF